MIRSTNTIQSVKNRCLRCSSFLSTYKRYDEKVPSAHYFSSIPIFSRKRIPPTTFYNTDFSLSFSSKTKIEPIIKADTQNDFFGEAITFLWNDEDSLEGVDKNQIMDAYDQHLLAILSKGKSTKGGGDTDGVSVQMAHSVAMVWAELLEYILVSEINGTKNDIITTVPMLAVVAVAPILAQADVVYLRRIDTLLKHCTHKGHKMLSLLEVARQATSLQQDGRLTPREKLHLQALTCLLPSDDPKSSQINIENNPTTNLTRDMGSKKAEALTIYLSLLRQCPGDALALSMAIDLSYAIGESWAAFEAATICYAYWQDRRRTISGYTIGASWIAVGLAAGGRFAAAEALIQQSNNIASVVDLEGCGGIAAWAMAIVLDAEGRVAEGISTLKGYDGVRKFEAAALLQFDSRLMGYGGRWALDREGQVKREEIGHILPKALTSSPSSRKGRTILRVYDNAFDRIIRYSGYSQQLPWKQPQRLAPVPKFNFLGIGSSSKKDSNSPSLISSLFSWNKDSTNEKTSAKTPSSESSDKKSSTVNQTPEIVDVLTWLPPAPQLLTDATLLLLRATLHGSGSGVNIIDGSDARWANLRNAWLTLLKEYSASEIQELSPMSLLAASMVCHHDDSLFSESIRTREIEGAALLGILLGLGERGEIRNNVMNEEDLDDDDSFQDQRDSWRRVALYLSNVEVTDDDRDLVDNHLSSGLTKCWEVDARPIMEIAICYAALRSKDLQALALARAICSKGVALRSSSPEEWHRYSMVLDELGDYQAAERALSASISMGAGEGGAGVH